MYQEEGVLCDFPVKVLESEVYQAWWQARDSTMDKTDANVERRRQPLSTS